MTTATLPTRNEAWGFFGTMSQDRVDAQRAWEIASTLIAAATDASPEGVRDFLDSRHGRHFADEVSNALHEGRALDAAIEHAVARWQGWRIDRRTSRETGIPAGLPYLTGWVAHFQILDEIDAAE